MADYKFYTGTYLGNSIPEADFPRLAKRAEEQLSILEIVPAPIEPNPEAPGGAAVVFRRGKLDLRPIGAKTYTKTHIFFAVKTGRDFSFSTYIPVRSIKRGL